MKKLNNLPDNKESTRYQSTLQENYVANVISGVRSTNSGASLFSAGDVYNVNASLLVECKTSMTERDSFSIKKKWIIKNKDEAFSKRLSNSAVAFQFAPNAENYFIIDEKLMRFLVEKLVEEYK